MSVTVICDHCTAMAPCTGDDPGAVRSIAKVAGWVYVDVTGSDFCPDCAHRAWRVMTPEETAEYMAAHPAFDERVKAHARELLTQLGRLHLRQIEGRDVEKTDP